MQKIIPHLWFDTQAKEAANFYTSTFPDSKITHSTTLHDTPSGEVDSVTFELSGYTFMAISAGPYFKLNPAISFMLNFDPSQDEQAEQHLKELWEKLADGGQALMPLQKYDFSKLYGWIQDKYGITWQLILTNPEGEKRPFIVPSFLFVGPAMGKAKDAADFYLSVFKNSKLGNRQLYAEGMEPNKPGTVMFSDFMLENQWFVAMDGGTEHAFEFNEAISLLVTCENQEEIDYYWQKLSAVPESEQCGWLKDKFGMSWQISPSIMNEMMASGSSEQIARVTQAFLKMKKFDIQELKTAFDGQ
jgi:predicted 3-demethylubiquinone-9 3-methyltransferase (glyoxalase superfamily)